MPYLLQKRNAMLKYVRQILERLAPRSANRPQTDDDFKYKTSKDRETSEKRGGGPRAEMEAEGLNRRLDALGAFHDRSPSGGTSCSSNSESCSVSWSPNEKGRAIIIKLSVGNTEPIGGDTARSPLDMEFRGCGFEEERLELAKCVGFVLLQRVEKEMRATREGTCL